MLYTVKHRCVGYPDDKPSEYIIEAKSKEEAIDIFCDAHIDLNYFIVSVESHITPSDISRTVCQKSGESAIDEEGVIKWNGISKKA